jgi:hypothetical protein
MSDSVSLTSKTISDGAFTCMGLIELNLLWRVGGGPQPRGPST